MHGKLLLGLGLSVLAATPLPAQSAISSSKSEAILGAPSKLAALVAAQSGSPASALLRPAVVSTPIRPQLAQAVEPAPALAAAGDRPDVFGSVALAIGRTRLDGRWSRVRQSRATGRAAAWAASLRDLSPTERVAVVNRFVNARVSFVDDSRQYRSADVWQTASDTLRRGRGDCEDYAIAKLQLLRAAGIGADDLYLVIAKDLVRRSDHAVLVVRAGGRLMLLDNMTDRITDATVQQDYRPVITYAAAGGAWTHGYRRAAPAVEWAAAPTSDAPVSSATLAIASLAATALR